MKKARAEAPALIVLDLMLPRMSGLEVCKVLKTDASTRHIPIIMLTAKAEEVDRIVGLEFGADDYVTKPFSPREMLLRIKAILRRGQNDGAEESMTRGAITIDPARHRVLVAGKPIVLTAVEFKLLSMLMKRPGRVQARDRLLNEVWGYESAIDTRTVDTHVRRCARNWAKPPARSRPCAASAIVCANRSDAWAGSLLRSSSLVLLTAGGGSGAAGLCPAANWSRW